jgi:hypothetical protein
MNFVNEVLKIIKIRADVNKQQLTKCVEKELYWEADKRKFLQDNLIEIMEEIRKIL